MGPKTEMKSNTDYHDNVFIDLAFLQGRISGTHFADCRFEGCSFLETEFQECKFKDCVFESCDLSMIKVTDSSFNNTQFQDCKVVGVNWTLAEWSSNLIKAPLRFKKCSLNHSTFIGLQMNGTSIVDCTASNCDFRETELVGADLSETDFSNSLFGKTNFTSADLRGASNYHIDPGKNLLARAKFSLPEAMTLLFSMDIELFDDD